MIYKTVGTILLLSSAVFFSVIKLRREKLQLDCVLEFINLLRFISKNIECFLKPLPDIIDEYQCIYLKENRFHEVLKKQNLLTAIQYIRPYMSSESYTLIEAYGKSVGKGYKEEELKLCAYTCDALQAISEKMRENYKNHTRMTRTLPFMFALSLVLLFW